MYSTTTKAIADYVGKEFGAAMRTLVNTSVETIFTKPVKPEPEGDEDKVDPLDIEEWKTKLNCYYKKLDKYEEDKARVYVIIKGQCTTVVKNKVEAHSEYHQTEQDYNVIALLHIIKEITFKSRDKWYGHLSAYYTLKNRINMKMDNNESHKLL